MDFNGISTHPPWTWFAHVASMFTGVRGSTRYKFLNGNALDALTSSAPIFGYDWSAVTAQPSFSGAVDFTGVLAPAATSESVRVINGTGQWEVLMPYYDNAKFWQPRWVGNLTSCWSERLDAFQCDPGVGADMVMFVAGGPDTAFVRFRRVPGIKGRIPDS